MFPIRTNQGKIVAVRLEEYLWRRTTKVSEFSGTPIYSKSRTLYALDVARDSVRRKKPLPSWSKGTWTVSLATRLASTIRSSILWDQSYPSCKPKLVSARFSDRIVVNFDRDTAGSAATLKVARHIPRTEFQDSRTGLAWRGHDPGCLHQVAWALRAYSTRWEGAGLF